MSLIDLQTRAALVTLYNEGHRYYHTLNHVYDCLTKLEEYTEAEPRMLGSLYHEYIEAALWFHDAVYNPSSKKNEINSALLFANFANDRKDIPGHGLEEIKHAILATQTHKPTCFTEQVVCDIDLSILGSSEKQYSEYVFGIRKEYVPIYGPNKVDEGRKLFIQKMLSQNNIFHIGYFKTKYEPNVKQNLLRELDEINRGFW